MMISKRMSDGIYIAGFISTLLVVAIHYNTKLHINTAIDGFGINYYIQEFIANGISRIAVPYFALVSGLFFFIKYRGILDYRRNVRNRVKTLLIPYVLTSLLFFIIEFFYLKLWLDVDFNLYSAIETIFLRPVSVQHWFLRDLIILTVLAPLFQFVRASPVGLVIVCSLLVLWVFDFEFLPIISGRHMIKIEVLAYFFLGAILSSKVDAIESHLKKVSFSFIFSLLIIYTSLLTLRIYLKPDYANFLNFSIEFVDNYTVNTLLLQSSAQVIGIYLLVVICYRFQSQKLVVWSSMSFFIFLFHGVPLNRAINKFSDFFIEDAYKFYFNFPLSIVITSLVAIYLSRQAPAIYSILTGGRGIRVNEGEKF